MRRSGRYSRAQTTCRADAAFRTILYSYLARDGIGLKRRLAFEIVIASEAKQSMDVAEERVDCFVATLLAMTVKASAPFTPSDETSRRRAEMNLPTPHG